MSDYYISLFSNTVSDLERGTWIMLYHVNQVPPHLVLIHDGNYYSLSVKGTKIAEPLESLIRNIQTKQHQCLAFSIDLSSSEIQNKSSLLKKYFEHFEEPEAGVITCLFPIRSALTELLNRYFERCEFVFELYKELKKYNLILNAVQINMNDLLDENGGFHLTVYQREDIDACIDRLKIVHVEG